MSESKKKTALVTGSTDGIGKQTALELLRKGFRVIVHGRSDAKVAATIDELKKQIAKSEILGWSCDLSSLAEVRAKASDLLTMAPHLEVLLHNAGTYQRSRVVTPEGFELTLAVSHLAPFLLTHLLLPALEAAAPARVVVVSSQVHMSGKLNLADLQLAKNYSGYGAYGQAKLCNVLFANGLAARFSPERLAANSLHPGVVGTKLLKQGFGMRDGPDSLAEGAETSVHLAASAEVEGVSGRYFVRSRETACSSDGSSVRLREELWKRSEELTGAQWKETPR